MTAQIILVAAMLVNLGFVAARHGEQREPYCFPVSFVDFAITIGLLWWGGFFGNQQ